MLINPLNAELNPIRHLLALVGARHIVHVSRIRVNTRCLCILPCLEWVRGAGEVLYLPGCCAKLVSRLLLTLLYNVSDPSWTASHSWTVRRLKNGPVRCTETNKQQRPLSIPEDGTPHLQRDGSPKSSMQRADCVFFWWTVAHWRTELPKFHRTHPLFNTSF